MRNELSHFSFFFFFVFFRAFHVTFFFPFLAQKGSAGAVEPLHAGRRCLAGPCDYGERVGSSRLQFGQPTGREAAEGPQHHRRRRRSCHYRLPRFQNPKIVIETLSVSIRIEHWIDLVCFLSRSCNCSAKPPTPVKVKKAKKKINKDKYFFSRPFFLTMPFLFSATPHGRWSSWATTLTSIPCFALTSNNSAASHRIGRTISSFTSYLSRRARPCLVLWAPVAMASAAAV